MGMKKSYKYLLALSLIIMIFEIIVAYIGEIQTRQPWGDEIRLYASVLNFGDNFSFDLLKHYRQMSTPLPFIIYALWGKLFGFELFTLRILSILIAISTYLLFFNILYLETDNIKLSIVSTLFLVVNPYMVGLSIFVFTDMPTIFFLLLAYYAMRKQQMYLFTISLACSILCRQYILYVIPAFLIYFGYKYLIEKNKIDIKWVSATLASLIPYGLLIILWGGTSPDNEYRAMYLTDGFYFHIDNFYLYTALLFIYLLPFYFFLSDKFYSSLKIMIPAAFCSLGYYYFPISPSKYSIDIGVYTVGLFHKVLVFLQIPTGMIEIIFFASTLLGLPILFTILSVSIKKLSEKNFDSKLLLSLLILFFFVVMPFSYLGWEKYFVQVLPFVIILFTIYLNQKSTNNRLHCQTD